MYQSKESKKNLENAKSDLRSAKDNTKAAIRSEFDDASDRAEGRVRDLRETAREAGERVQHFFTERRDDVQHARDAAERTIRANPLASALGALVGGIILGRLMR